MAKARLALPEGWETWAEPRKLALRNQLRLASFQTTYHFEPAAFVRDCFDWDQLAEDGPTPYQEETLKQIIEYRRLALRGPHGIGKTSIAAWLIHWFALTRDGWDWKAPTTASVWRQLERYLWPEVHKWARLLRWDRIGRHPYIEGDEMLDLALQLRTGEAFAVASNNPAAIEGAHADHILYVYDEAKTIEDQTFDASEGAFAGAGGDTKREAYAVALSTPGEPQGRFYQIHRRAPEYQHWRARHVRKEDAIKAGRMSQEWAELMRVQWASEPAIYKNRVEGEFAVAGTTSVIPLLWIEQANERWRELAVQGIDGSWAIPEGSLSTFTCVGVDIADEGGDHSCLALRFGNIVSDIRRFAGNDTMETTGMVVGILRRYGIGYSVVDVIGMGAGPVARLREQKMNVQAFNASERSTKSDKTGELEFLNKRAEVWWGMRERLDPTQPGGSQIALPPDDLLTGDLTAPKYMVTSAGKIQIEGKEDIRKRIGRSTDTGDAVVMAFWSKVTQATVTRAGARRLPGS